MKLLPFIEKNWKWWILILGILISVLTFLLCYFYIPRIQYAYDSVSDSYYVNYVYGNAKHYDIADEWNDKPVIGIRSRAFQNKNRLESVRMGQNVIFIERLAFQGCTSLIDISLVNIQEIGRNAFEGCTSLAKVELSIKNIMGGTFHGCTALKDVKLNQTLHIGSYAFAYSGIENITLPVTVFNVEVDAFYECTSLKTIRVMSMGLLNDPYLQSLDGVMIVQ